MGDPIPKSFLRFLKNRATWYKVLEGLKTPNKIQLGEYSTGSGKEGILCATDSDGNLNIFKVKHDILFRAFKAREYEYAKEKSGIVILFTIDYPKYYNSGSRRKASMLKTVIRATATEMILIVFLPNIICWFVCCLFKFTFFCDD